MYYKNFIGLFGSLICSKTLMVLIFNPYGEFRRSPEGPVSQIHSPHLHVGARGIFSNLLRSVQMLKREWSAESNEKLPNLFIPSKTATLVCGGRPAFGQNRGLGAWVYIERPCLGKRLWWNTCLRAELRPWSLSSQRKTCTCAEHSDDDDKSSSHYYYYYY